MAKKNITFAEIRKLHQEGDLTAAKQGYITLLNQTPDNVEILHALAIVYAQENQFNEAMPYLQKAIQLQPNNPVLYLHLANVFKNMGLLENSIKVLKQIIELDPNCISAYNNLGIVYFSQGKFTDAIKAYRMAFQKQPDYIDAHYNLGLALIKNHEIEDAVEVYENLLKHTPTHFAARFHLACILMQQNKISSAEKHFLIIEENHPHHFETQTNLATCFLKQGALIEAKKHYVNALALSPQDTQVLFNLGVINTQLDNIDNAIQHYQMALQSDPDFFAAHNNLGGLFILKQHPGFALQHFKEALRLQPENKAIQYTVAALSKNQRLLTAPPDYITTLFDAYADHYDAHLLKALDYQVPQLFYAAAKDMVVIPTKQWDILDLGCGTGLCGIPFKAAAKTLTGVDLSTKMLAEAAQKNVYDDLVASDLNTFLINQNAQFDLILAGDVLVYIGDLNTLFKNIHHALRTQGLFIFNAEISDTTEFTMNQSGRFSHRKDYLDKLASEHQFKIIYYKKVITRLQNNQPVYGHVYGLKF
jgi:predicted TPR repeat methyltransferase